MTPRVEVVPVAGFGEVRHGNDLAELVVTACEQAGCPWPRRT
jgi:hypothetical protein